MEWAISVDSNLPVPGGTLPEAACPLSGRKQPATKTSLSLYLFIYRMGRMVSHGLDFRLGQGPHEIKR